MDENIHPKWLVPMSYIGCPRCGKTYKGRVCLLCEECAKCCTCEEPKFVKATEALEEISKTGELIGLKYKHGLPVPDWYKKNGND